MSALRVIALANWFISQGGHQTPARPEGWEAREDDEVRQRYTARTVSASTVRNAREHTPG